MNGRRVIRLSILMILVALLLFPLSVLAQEPTGGFTNAVVEGSLTSEAQGQLATLIQDAFKALEPNLAGYDIEAETRVSADKDETLRCDTVATLRSLTSKQAYLFRVVHRYSPKDKSWAVIETDPNYVPEVAVQGGSLAQEEVDKVLAQKQKAFDSLNETQLEGTELESYSNARFVAFAPISSQDSWAGWAADRITGKFRAGGWLSDEFKSPSALEPTAWNYLKYGGYLYTWYSNSHGVTASYNGAPCYGLVYNGGTLTNNEFTAMNSWTGLLYCVAYVDACNSYMNPLRSSILTGHSVRTYVGGLRLMPFTSSDKCDERFWKYVLTDGRTFSYALATAMSNFSLVGYYALTGYNGTWSPQALRIQLTWGYRPYDLDSHLWLPTSRRYHVYYAARGSATSNPYAWLDRDDLTSYGPENIRIVEAYPGTYRYCVYNWSGTPALAGSGATVRLYRGSTLIRTYVVPASGSGRWWVVFDYSGTTGAITTRNYITSIYPGLYGVPEEMPAAK